MIGVTVELFPYGEAKLKREIGHMTITNDGTGTKERGNYQVGVFGKEFDRCYVKEFDRLNKDVFDLIYEALKIRKKGGE